MTSTVFYYRLLMCLLCSLEITFVFGNQAGNQSLQLHTQAPTHKIPDGLIAGNWENLPGRETLDCPCLSSRRWLLLQGSNTDLGSNSVLKFT